LLTQSNSSRVTLEAPAFSARNRLRPREYLFLISSRRFSGQLCYLFEGFFQAGVLLPAKPMCHVEATEVSVPVEVKENGKLPLWSRNKKSLNRQFPLITDALKQLPDGTVIDGEVVAMGDDGRPNFNLLQNFKSEAKRIRFFVFDLLWYKNRDLTRLNLLQRHEILRSLKLTDNRVSILDYLEATPHDVLAAVGVQGLEGIIGKR
jgi:hypothetical protein